MFVAAFVAYIHFYYLTGCAPERSRVPKPIDAETISAYEKLGAKYGEFSKSEDGYFDFSSSLNTSLKGIPGF